MNNSFINFLIIMLTDISIVDLIIIAIGVGMFVLLQLIKSKKKEVSRKLEDLPHNPDWAIDMYKKLNFRYALFLTVISVFPLFGMFGTVESLLTLDFSNVSDNIDSIKANFFRALTSTAWGLLFSIIYKVCNSIFFYDIDDYFEELEKIIRENKKNGNDSKSFFKKKREVIEKECEDDSDEE